MKIFLRGLLCLFCLKDTKSYSPVNLAYNIKQIAMLVLCLYAIPPISAVHWDDGPDT